MKRVVVLLCVLCCFQWLQGQQVFTGKLIGKKDGAVSGATVHVLNTAIFLVSSDQGLFTIPSLPKGTYAIEISAIGYASIEKRIEIPQVGSIAEISLPSLATELDAVIVTADKSESNIQHVPVSITALSSRDIDAYRLWSSKDLKGIVSNMSAGDPGDGRNVISIRGITSTSYDPAIVTYIDGVPQFTLDTYIPQLFDIDHIDVLKGPQGTLYGRNAMGGVINIVTKSPDNAVHGAVDLSAGNYGLQRYTAQLNLPLIKNKLFLGVAGLYEGSNGFYTNDFNQSHFDKQHRYADNISLKYLMNAQWSFNLNVKNLWNRNMGAFPLNPSVSDALVNPYHLDQNAVGEMVDNTTNASLLVRHTGAKLDFSSLTAYQSNYRYYKQPVDGDFSPLDIISIVNDYGKAWNNLSTWTEELRLGSSAASTDPLKWAIGSSLFIQNVPNQQGVHFGADAALAGSPDSFYTIINTSRITNKGIAFYGQLDYAISKHVQLAAGLRYDYQHAKAEVSGEYLPDGSSVGFPTQPDTTGSASYHALSPMASITWQPDQHSDIYFSYKRGFRTGGLTQLSSDPSQPPLYPYQPEYSNNFELGFKGHYFENRFHANLAIFYTTVSDVQIPTLILPDAITVIKNGGGLTSRGVEAELQGIVIPGLELTYHIGYTHAEYSSGELSQNGTSFPLKGQRQIFTPDMTSMLAAQYNHGLSEKMNLFVRMEWYYFGRQYFDLANLQQQSSYQLLNASAGMGFSHVNLSLWFRNIGETKYIAYAYDFGAARLGDPFTYGASLKFRF